MLFISFKTQSLELCSVNSVLAPGPLIFSVSVSDAPTCFFLALFVLMLTSCSILSHIPHTQAFRSSFMVPNRFPSHSFLLSQIPSHFHSYFKKIFTMCVCVFCLNVCLFTMCSAGPEEARRGCWNPGAGVRNGCDLPHGC